MFGVAQNITESKQTEEYIRYLNTELQGQLDEMNTLMKILPTGVWIGNHDCSEITGNPAAYQLLGFESGINVSVTNPEPQVPSGLRIFVNGEEILPEDAPMQVVARSGKPWHGFEHELLFPDGMRKSIYGSVIPLFDEYGAVRKVIASYTDFTERKRLEDERTQALHREQAQRASAEQAKLEAEQAKAETERELAERKLAEAALGEWANAPLPQDKRSPWLRYGAALVATLVALLIRVMLDPVLGDALALVTIYGAVAFSVWYGGVGPAILSALLGYLAITGLIVDPSHAVTLNAQNVTGFALFLFSNTVVMALGESMRRAQRHAHQSARVAVERQHQVETQLQEKQLAEESLRQSEALYRGIARSIPGGGVYVVDKDFRYLVAEGPVTEAFGLSREILEGRTVSEAFPKEAAERMEARLQRNFAGETVDFETEHNGRFYWSQQAPMIDASGSVENAIIMTIDITERKQVEEALRRSEERFARFMQQLPGLAWIKDREGRYVYANAAAEKAFKAPREKLYGRTDEEIFPAEFAAQYRKNDELALMDEKGVQVTETLEHENGVLHYSLVSKFPIPGPDGSTTLIGGTAFDITERKQAEEALRESEERFRALLRQATAGIVRKDAEGRFLFVNQAFCNMLGYTESELLGTTVWDFTHPDDLEENKKLYDRTMMEGIPFKLEKRLIREDGTIVWVDVSVSPIMDAAGKPQSAVAVEVDISRRKQAEEALQQLNLQLENRVEKRTVELQAVNQSLRDEIAERLKVEDALHESRKRLQILSQRLVDVQEEERRAIARELHDRVGQSLSALNINLVILDNQISNHATQQIRTRMDDSIQLVSETITLVRDVMSDLRPPVLDDYGLEAALQSHVDAFKSRHGIDVQFEKSDQPIPRLGPSIEMTFLRIAQEALINVARHAKAEKVSLSLTRDEKVVRLVVQDNGSGITSWHEANRPGSHGLTIMRERAEAFGGNLKVSSVPGNGTKIEASIPIETGDQENVQKERHE
jgi:PAS domain S-box-containing protein